MTNEERLLRALLRVVLAIAEYTFKNDNGSRTTRGDYFELRDAITEGRREAEKEP